MTDRPTLTRRGLMVAGGATVLGSTTVLLAACSPSTEPVESSSAPPSPQPNSLAAGDELAKLADIAVGGTLGVKVQDTDVLLAQPTEGQVVAFSAICKHQGCIVAAVGAEFDCPCHGSRYESATGAVLNGPAQEPLDAIPVTISGDAIVVA